MGRRKWHVAAYDKELVSSIAAENGIDVFAALLLACRNITDSEEVESFCFSNEEMCDPFELPDMELAVEAIASAVDEGEKIAVFGDYDADGVTATALLSGYLRSQGADIITYIPDRNREGYGLNIPAVDKLHSEGVQLIITVDNGISATEEAEHIAKLGMKLVITDHHMAGDVLPKAIAVVDAHRRDSDCSFKQWAGVGVAFKLICALEGEDGETMLNEYAQLVAIGTIADVVPLMGENRTIVKRGLELMNARPIEGISAMREVAGTADKPLNSSAVAFTIVPRINAMGRIGSVDSALSLLSGTDDIPACAAQLDESNSLRQHIETDIMKQAIELINDNPSLALDRVIVIANEGWHAGVIGIVASRMVERYSKPCIIITSDGETAKGSGRSIDGFSLYDAMCSAADLLTHSGGHTLAVGFGIKSSDIDEFRVRINEYAKSVSMPFASLNIDCKLRPESLGVELTDAFSLLEPFGAGNPQPMFGLFGMTLTAIQPVGNGRHLRLTFTKNGYTVIAMRFSTTPEELPYVEGDTLDLAVRLEKNVFRGETKLSIQIKAMRPNGSDDDAYLGGIRLYEKILRNEEITQAEATLAYPERSFVASVFRIIRDSGTYYGEADVICMRLKDNGGLSCRVMVALEAMCELRILIRNEDGSLSLPENGQKTDLEQSVLLRRLKQLI